MELVTQAVSALLKVELQAAIVLLGKLQSLDFERFLNISFLERTWQK